MGLTPSQHSAVKHKTRLAFNTSLCKPRSQHHVHNALSCSDTFTIKIRSKQQPWKGAVSSLWLHLILTPPDYVSMIPSQARVVHRDWVKTSLHSHVYLQLILGSNFIALLCIDSSDPQIDGCVQSLLLNLGQPQQLSGIPHLVHCLRLTSTDDIYQRSRDALQYVPSCASANMSVE